MDFASKELSENNIDFKVVGDQTLFEIIFTNEEILNYRDVKKNDLKIYSKFNQILKENGVFKPIGKMYISLSLTEDDFSQTQTAIAKAASVLRN